MDPLRQCLRVFDYDDDLSETGAGPSEKASKGILIFFHGSPCEGICVSLSAYKVNCYCLYD